MEATVNILHVIAGMAIITFLIRFLPLIGGAAFRLPRLADVGLRYAVISLLCAILFQNLFLVEGHLLTTWDFKILAAIISIIAMLLTKNLLLTVVSGTAVVCIVTVIL